MPLGIPVSFDLTLKYILLQRTVNKTQIISVSRDNYPNTDFTKCSVRRRAEAFLFQEGWVILRSFSLHPYFQSRRYQKGFFFSPKTLMNNVISVTAGRALRKVGDGFRVSSNKNTQIPKPAIPPPTPWSVGVEDFKQTQECWVDLVSYRWSKGLGR